MYKIAMSINVGLLNEQTFKALKKAGIYAIEISGSSISDFSSLNLDEAKALSDKYDIKLWSFHLPFAPFDILDPASTDEEIRKNTFNIFAEYIKSAVAVGIKIFVAHPSREPIEENREKRLECAANFFSELADFAAEYGAVIAIEDLPRSCLGNCSDEINYIISKNDKLKVCFDTNHLLEENITDFIRNIGSKIVTLHVSDYDAVNERHWLPGEGIIDWQSLYNELKAVGYDGVWLYEIGLLPSKSIERRTLGYDDFYKNALEIFEGKKPTAIGKPKENRGFWG